MSRLSSAITVAFIFALSSVVPALAQINGDTHPVPEPTTLSLLSGGAALVIIGARWLRRK